MVVISFLEDNSSSFKSCCSLNFLTMYKILKKNQFGMNSLEIQKYINSIKVARFRLEFSLLKLNLNM